jgi:O-antigen/teichoic acid export membrane protein
MNARTGQLSAHLRSVLQVARLRPFDISTPEGRSQERYRRIVLSTGASIAGRVVATGVALVAVPLVVSYLGKEQYGLWAAILTLAPWVALFDLGLVNGHLNAIAEARGRDDPGAARTHLSTALVALTAIAVALAAAAALALPALPWSALLGAPASLAPGTVTWAVGAALWLFLAAMPLGLLVPFYTGEQRGYVGSSFLALGTLASLGLLAVAIRLGASLPWVTAAAASPATLAGLGALAYLLLRDDARLRPRARHATRASLRRQLATSVPLYLFQLGSLLVNQSQQLVLARNAGLATVAEYDLLSKAYLLCTGLITVSTASFAPTFRESVERGEADWMRRGFRRLVTLRVALAGGACLLLLGGGNLAFRVWLGRGDFQFAFATWAALCAYLLVAAWASSFLELMMVLDRIWPLVAVVLAQGALTVLLTALLGRHLGVLGATLGVAIPAAGLTGWLVPLLARPHLRAVRAAPSATWDRV